MELNQEMLELLRKIEKSNRTKSVTNVLICIFMLAAAVSCIAVCVMLAGLMPQVNNILVQMETALASLEQTSSDLAALELESMVTNVDAMAVMAQESLAATMAKLDLIDFETLNKAIEDLSRVIKPLADFVGLFDR